MMTVVSTSLVWNGFCEDNLEGENKSFLGEKEIYTLSRGAGYLRAKLCRAKLFYRIRIKTIRFSSLLALHASYPIESLTLAMMNFTLTLKMSKDKMSSDFSQQG